jgi:hypothetical protein
LYKTRSISAEASDHFVDPILDVIADRFAVDARAWWGLARDRLREVDPLTCFIRADLSPKQLSRKNLSQRRGKDQAQNLRLSGLDTTLQPRQIFVIR